jgi:hypothetical protein
MRLAQEISDNFNKPIEDEQKWVNYIKEYCYSESKEKNHVQADKALKLFLLSLGHSAIVEEWEKVEKWYA